MTGNNRTKIDGHWYKPGDEMPDLGSLVCVSDDKDGKIRNYEGLSQDVGKLPKYDRLETGSSAFFYDTKELYKYEKTTKTWYKL